MKPSYEELESQLNNALNKIKASQEQEPIYEVVICGAWAEVKNKFDYDVRTENERRIRYAQPIIPPEMAELQRELRIAKAHEAASDEANKTLGKEIAELRKLLSEARKVPEGWKLVPVEPSRGMMRAAKEADMNHDTFDEWMFSDGDDLMRVYAAMLNASPEYKEPKP